ncbi:hypothetical protein EB796_004109 [Bugula neritina]|uniref:Uncharacterized protein n=1 Tax=Bugula neritina TaxID=10212 RepID=A0A7J7KI64_BUGNE|nr:hypothetical protein EB796_004109 [Bugula neritina]
MERQQTEEARCTSASQLKKALDENFDMKRRLKDISHHNTEYESKIRLLENQLELNTQTANQQVTLLKENLATASDTVTQLENELATSSVPTEFKALALRDLTSATRDCERQLTECKFNTNLAANNKVCCASSSLHSCIGKFAPVFSDEASQSSELCSPLPTIDYAQFNPSEKHEPPTGYEVLIPEEHTNLSCRAQSAPGLCSAELHQPPNQFVRLEKERWGTGPECTTVLCNSKGKAVAWINAPHKHSSGHEDPSPSSSVINATVLPGSTSHTHSNKGAVSESENSHPFYLKSNERNCAKVEPDAAKAIRPKSSLMSKRFTERRQLHSASGHRMGSAPMRKYTPTLS